MLSNPDLDPIVNATPVSSHYDLALQSLTAGKQVFVEKPFTQTTEQGERLVADVKKARPRTACGPLTDGYSGLRVVHILEAATQSLAERGKLIELIWKRS